LWIASGVLASGAVCAGSPPDIQGIWTSGTLTPFERPQQLRDGDPPEQQRAAAEKFWAAGHKAGEVGRDNDAFIDQDLKILPNGQTSLVVEPANGTRPRFAHLSVALVQEGDTVEPGQVVGRAGSSGRATAPHLHLEVTDRHGRLLNPLGPLNLPD
jgi:hypothetical protein